MTRERWMALCFALGSTCFLVGPFPGYASLVGSTGVGLTFFVGSILFTAGGGLQTWLAAPDRHEAGAGRAGWWAAVDPVGRDAVLQRHDLPGAVDPRPRRPDYDRLVWRPDALGSVCFLVSGVIAYRAVGRGTASARPAAARAGGSRPSTSSAASSSASPRSPAMSSLPPGRSSTSPGANWNTALGAACFLACALATLRTGRTTKSPRFRRLRALEHTIERDLGRDVEWSG